MVSGWCSHRTQTLMTAGTHTATAKLPNLEGELLWPTTLVMFLYFCYTITFLLDYISWNKYSFDAWKCMVGIQPYNYWTAWIPLPGSSSDLGVSYLGVNTWLYVSFNDACIQNCGICRVPTDALTVDLIVYVTYICLQLVNCSNFWPLLTLYELTTISGRCNETTTSLNN